MNKITTILFDLGGVIMTIDQSEAVRRFTEIGLKDACKQLDPYTQGGIFGDLESGKISDEEFRAELSVTIGHEVTWEQCQYAWMGYCGGVPERNLKLLLNLREQGYRVVLVSNTNPFMMAWAMDGDFDGKGNPLSHYVDKAYLSYECKVMKPNERFFRIVTAEEKIIPNETLFVDDGPRNVAAASQLGMHTFCPQNGADWTEEIFDHINTNYI